MNDDIDTSLYCIGAFNYLSGVNSLSPDGQTLMSAQSPWGLKYTGSTVFDQSTGTSSVPVTCSHTLSHSHIEEVEEEEGDSSRGKHYSRRYRWRCTRHHYHRESDCPPLHFTGHLT